jgi:hypothetical protein
LRVTAKGRAALEQWLVKIPPDLGSSTADPIRTRVHFLKAVDTLARKRALDDYRAATLLAIAGAEAELKDKPESEVDRSERLGTLGALAELRARLAWLDEAERELSGE